MIKLSINFLFSWVDYKIFFVLGDNKLHVLRSVGQMKQTL